MNNSLHILIGLAVAQLVVAEEWTQHSPRNEISPNFERSGQQFVLSSDNNIGTNGHWRRDYPVEGGSYYQFRALRKAENIESTRRSCVVRIEWYGENGQPVVTTEPVNKEYFGNAQTLARPDYPRDKGKIKDWTKVEDTYLAPPQATTARVQLHLRWTQNGKITWKEMDFRKVPAPEKRIVKLAAIHHQLNGKRETSSETYALLEPLIEQAALKGADLIVLTGTHFLQGRDPRLRKRRRACSRTDFQVFWQTIETA